MITQSGWNPTPAVGIPPLRLAPHRIKLVSHTILAVHCRLAQTSKTQKMITQSGWNPTTAVGIPPLRLASHRIKLVSQILLAVHCRLAQTSKTKKQNDHTKWLESHHCGWHPTAAVGTPPH